MAAFNPRLPLAWAVLLVTAASAQGQTLDAAGKVVLVGPDDSLPQAGVPVVLHQVGRDFQGPIDTVMSGPDGGFAFTAPRDTSALYLLSANHHGIEYFSAPIHTNPDRPDTAIVLAVSDTSSAQPVETAERQLVVGAAGTDGTRPVVDLFRMVNSGVMTRVAGRAQQPTWVGRLDPAVIGFQVGRSDFSSEAVFLRGDTLEVFGPVSPGAKELMVRYLVTEDELTIFNSDSLQRFTLLVEEADARVAAPEGLVAEVQSAGGREFRSWTGAVAAGSTVTISFPGATSQTALLAALVALMSAILLTAVVLRRRRGSMAPAGETPDQLISQLARLDERYRGREDTLDAAAIDSYRLQRQALKEKLASALARTQRKS